MSRVVHFEIPSDNPEKAIEFYGKVFGWKMTRWDGPMEYWLASTGDPATRGIDGAVLRRPHPGATVVNTIGVASVDDAAAKVAASGGKLAVPKMAIPGMGWVAYCTDPDGNTFGLFQEDSRAK